MKKINIILILSLTSCFKLTRNSQIEDFLKKEKNEIENFLNDHPTLKKDLEIADTGLTIRRIFLIARAYKQYKDENENGNIKDFFKNEFETLKNKLKNIKSKFKQKNEENNKSSEE